MPDSDCLLPGRVLKKLVDVGQRTVPGLCLIFVAYLFVEMVVGGGVYSVDEILALLEGSGHPVFLPPLSGTALLLPVLDGFAALLHQHLLLLLGAPEILDLLGVRFVEIDPVFSEGKSL